MLRLATPRLGRFSRAAALLGALALSACMRVSSDSWLRDEADVWAGDVRLVFQFAATKYGPASFGPPFRLQLTASGEAGTHEALVVHSIHVALDDGSEIEILDAKERTFPFGDVQGILDLHGTFVRFADTVSFEPEPDRRLTVRADITVITAEGSLREVVASAFHPNRVRRWAGPWEIATS